MAWMTMAQAAVATGVSVRTIYRRIDADQLETRREGRHTLVNIDLPEDSLADSGPVRGISAPVLTAGIAAASVDSFADGRNVGWRDVAVETLQGDTARARRSARLAWTLSVAAVLTLMLTTWKYQDAKLTYAEKFQAAGIGHSEEIEALIVSYEQHLQSVQVENACVIDELHDKIARMEGESAGVTVSLAENRQANELLQGQLVAVGSELSGTRAALATVTADRDRLASENTGLDGQVATLNERRSQQDKALAEMQTQVAIFTDQRDELDGDSTELRKQLVERTAENGHFRGQIVELADQRDELGMQVAALQQALDAEMELAGMHRGKLEALQAAHDWLADDVQKLRGNIEVARSARSEIERMLEGARTSLNHVTAERDQLNEQVAKLLQTSDKKVSDEQPGSEMAKSTIDLAKPNPPADETSSETASPQSKGTAEPKPSPRRLKITVTEPTTRPAADYRRYRLNPLRRTAFARERRW